MASLFNDRASLFRLQEGASAFQQDNPHFNQLLDVASGLMFNTGAGGLHPSDRRGLAMVMATLQNSAPGMMGTPVADFVAMNRALISGAMPVMTVGINGDRSSSNSYGTGNVSVAATASIMRTFEESMRTRSGAVDIGQTMGLSHNLRTDLLTHLVQERGIKKGDIVAYDLSKATTAASLGDRIKAMRAENVEDSSIRNLEKIQKAMQYLQTNLGTDDLASKGEATLAAKLEGQFDDSVIRQTIAQIKGKNTNFQTQTKQLNKELKEAYKDVAENVKELSNLFQTDDLSQLRTYAKGAGIGNFLDKNKAHEVRAQMRDIAVTAAITGRSAQEVAAERVQIATGMSAMYGGRVVSGDLISTVQQAGIAGSQSKDSGIFTREAAQAAATRSIANMQNVYSGAIIATSVFKQQEKLGGITDEMRAEFTALDAAQREAAMAGETEKAQIISMQMEDWTRRRFGDDVVDSPEARAFANANYSGEFQSRHAQAIRIENVRRHVERSSGAYNLDEAGKIRMNSIGNTLIDTFGNNQAAREKFLGLADANTSDKTAEAIDMLKNSGMSAEEAAQFVKGVQAEGKGVVSSMWNPFLSSARFVQQYGGKFGKGDRNIALVTELLSSETLNTTNMSAADGLIAGMLAEGGFTNEGVADAAIAEALHVATVGQGKSLDKAGQYELYNQVLQRRGITTLHLGQAEQDANGKFTGAFKLEDPAHREAMRKALGVSDDELTALLADPEAYIKKLEGAGINISSRNRDSIDGGKGLIGYTRISADQLRDKMAANVDQDAVKSMQQVFGSENVTMRQDASGEYQAMVNLPGTNEAVSVKDAVATLSGKASNAKLLADLSAAGNEDATKALSKVFKDSIKKEDRQSLANSGNKVAALALKEGDISAAQFQNAVRQTYGTENVEIFKNKNLDDWVREGLASRDFDSEGKATYKLTQTIGELGLNENDTLTADTIDEIAKKRDAIGRIDSISERMRGLLVDSSEQPVNYEQMSDVIKLLQRIAYNTD